MERTRKSFVVIAGEASGDMHGAHLVRALQKLCPESEFTGLGGTQMRAAGVHLYDDLTRLAVVGFWEVVKHYAAIKKVFHLILKKIDETKPDAVILIDYPGFNLRLARELKKRKIKVIYYISPQVWAWKKNRVYFIQKYVDHMLVLFPFEQKFYAQFGVNVSFVGHPLVDTVYATMDKYSFLQSQNLDPEQYTIALLPGSRQKEIERLLPVMLDAASQIHKDFPNIQFLIVQAPTIERGTIESYTKNKPVSLCIVGQNTYNCVHAADFCVVASGTATLETALLHKPMVIVYKTSFFTWLLAKMFVRIPYIGLVNVVAGKQIVPECVQNNATGLRIADQIRQIMTNEIRLADMKSELSKVKSLLGSTNASERAAREIINTFKCFPTHSS